MLYATKAQAQDDLDAIRQLHEMTGRYLHQAAALAASMLNPVNPQIIRDHLHDALGDACGAVEREASQAIFDFLQSEASREDAADLADYHGRAA